MPPGTSSYATAQAMINYLRGGAPQTVQPAVVDEDNPPYPVEPTNPSTRDQMDYYRGLDRYWMRNGYYDPNRSYTYPDFVRMLTNNERRLENQSYADKYDAVGSNSVLPIEMYNDPREGNGYEPPNWLTDMYHVGYFDEPTPGGRDMSVGELTDLYNNEQKGGYRWWWLDPNSPMHTGVPRYAPPDPYVYDYPEIPGGSSGSWFQQPR